MSDLDRGHAVVVGASYAGLCAATALRANGWRITVLERSPERSRSGGGVVVQPRMAEYLEERHMALPGISSIPARMRVLHWPGGRVLRVPETARAYTAWDVLLGELERAVGEETILRGTALESIEQDHETARAVLDDGRRISADLIVGADGLGSRTRALLLPGSVPEYAGYIAWRGTVDEREVGTEICRELTGTFSSFTASRTNVVIYEIPGSDGSIEPGERRLNWVWYLNVRPGTELDDMLSGLSGRRKRTTLPRGEVRPETLARLRSLARAVLPGTFADVVERTREPFAQAILDYEAPQLFFGRVVLIGDAACMIRPHLGSGTAKAVEDAVSLADAVCGPDYAERRCLLAWEQVRIEAHRAFAGEAKVVAEQYGLGLSRSGERASSARATPATRRPR